MDALALFDIVIHWIDTHVSIDPVSLVNLVSLFALRRNDGKDQNDGR